MNQKILLFQIIVIVCLISIMTSCIGDDFISDFREPEIRITTSLDTLEVNTSFQMTYMYLNSVGLEETVPAIWSSSDEGIATITQDGLLSGINEGNVTIYITLEEENSTLSDAVSIAVGRATVNSVVEFSGTIQTTSSYKLTGSFMLSEDNPGNLNLAFNSDYCASSALPGLYIYLSNNRNSIANAFEIGEVTDFSGAHSYEITNVGIMDYSFIVYFCKPFNVKVGDGQIQ